MTRTTRSLVPLIAAALLGGASVAQAGELRLGVGVFTLSDGADVQLGYRFENSRWLFGYRLLHYAEEFYVGGTHLTRTTTTKTGPFLAYLFRPEARGSWYLGSSLMYWRQHERSARSGTSGDDQTVAPFFGGGYMGRFSRARHLYWNFGLYVSPASLETRTADSEEKTTGADVQMQIGLAF